MTPSEGDKEGVMEMEAPPNFFNFAEAVDKEVDWLLKLFSIAIDFELLAAPSLRPMLMLVLPANLDGRAGS